MYSVHESFYSLQGEGARAGRPAVFVRFAGCNLWSGHERDRAAAACRFCDTQFVGTGGDGGGRFASAADLAQAAAALWPSPLPGECSGQRRENRGRERASQSADAGRIPGWRRAGQGQDRNSRRRAGGANAPYLVFTGGEPLLQLDEPLLAACKGLGFEVAVETNGTLPAPPGIDWVCVSPKAGADWVLRRGDELKLVYPQEGQDPVAVAAQGDFRHLWLQPMDGPDLAENRRKALDFCLAHPEFSLSLQVHKLLEIR